MTMFPAQPQLVKHERNYVYDARWTTLSTSSSCSRLVDEGQLYNNTSTSPSNINPLISREEEQLLLLSTMGDQDEEDHSTTNSSTNETGGSTTSNTNFIFDYTKQPGDYKQQHLTDDDGGGSGWLRLGMGMADTCQPRSSRPCHLLRHNQTSNSVESGGSMLELNLLPGSTTTSSTTLSFQQMSALKTTPSTSTSAFMVYQPPRVVQDQAGWASYLRNPKVMLPAAAAVASSSNSSGGSLLQLQPPQPQPQPDIRFIRPPRRPHSGIWFMLLPSFNQVTKQPSLPQLSKNYLRIKDGRMTVGLLIKYLVNKLGLDTESQVEIRCRGMELEGSLTMQHVRDRIWTSSASTYPSPPPPVAAAAAYHHHHIMLLHYATRTSGST